MSTDKDRYEAGRWLETAEEDHAAAKSLLQQGHFSHACFFAQQSGEKAVKALWFALGEDPWGHSVQKLIAEIPDGRVLKCMDSMIEKGALLDRYYIPTRYPNGLPDLTPGKAYFKSDAEQSIVVAREIIARVSECIEWV